MKTRRTECRYYDQRGFGGPRCLTGGDSGPQTTTQQQVFSPEEQAARNNVFSFGQQLFNKNQFSGIAGFAPETQWAQRYLMQQARGPGQEVANNVAGGLNFGLKDVMRPGANPYFQGHLQNATRHLTEDFMSPTGPMAQIRSGFTGNNSAGSGSREGIAMGLANRGYENAVGDLTARMSNDAYNRGLDTFEKTMAFSPTAYDLMMRPATTADAVGQQKQGLAQSKIDAPWANLQSYANLISGMSNPSMQATGPGAPKTSPLQGAAAGAAMGSAFGPYGTAIGAAAGFLMAS